jgi:hypothetical protein
MHHCDSLGLSQADHGDAYPDFFFGLELAFLVIFILELSANWFAYGELSPHPHPQGSHRDWAVGDVHWSDQWHWLDAFVVLTSIVDIIVSTQLGSSSSGISVLRLTRVLRVARVVGAVDKMAYLVTAFINGLK